MKYVALFLLSIMSAFAGETPYEWKAGTIVPTETVALAAAVAEKATRYQIANPLPTVYVLSAEDMDAMLPGNYGLVRYSDPTRVYLNEIIPANIRFAVLVHELVHIMQARSGVVPTDCLSNAANELEAYSASYRYLSVAGVKAPVHIRFECR